MFAAAQSDPTRFRYALSTVPIKDVYWGGDGNAFLCYRGKVLTVTFVARILSTYFKTSEQLAPPSASVKFKFLSNEDLAVARALVYAKSKPPKCMLLYPVAALVLSTFSYIQEDVLREQEVHNYK